MEKKKLDMGKELTIVKSGNEEKIPDNENSQSIETLNNKNGV